MSRPCQLDRLSTADRGDHAEACGFEHLCQPVAVGALVVDHEDLRLLSRAVLGEVEPVQAVDQVFGRNRLDEVIDGAECQAELGVVDNADDDHGNRARGGVLLESRQYLTAAEPRQQAVARVATQLQASLSTVTSPPSSRAKRRVRVSPRPVPCCWRSTPASTCWSSSKIRTWSLRAMPMPVSATETSTASARRLP